MLNFKNCCGCQTSYFLALYKIVSKKIPTCEKGCEYALTERENKCLKLVKQNSETDEPIGIEISNSSCS